MRFAKFFDSLRPAQDIPWGQGGPLGGIRKRPEARRRWGSRMRRRIRDTEQDKRDNNTTKSLILAQDER